MLSQKWIVVYFVALLLYQNPIYCVLVWLEHPSASSVYASYTLDAIGQATFFTVWLFFASAIYCRINTIYFYTSKVLFGLLILTSNMVVLTLQFPSLVIHRSIYILFKAAF